MTKNYQKKNASRATSDDLALPDAVSVAMADIAGSVKDGLLALAVAAGLQVMTAMMDESVTAVAGPKGQHQPGRTAVRHGSEAGSVVLGGRRVPVRRPRVRASDGSGELPVEAYDVFSNSDLLGDIALERIMAKLSTRRYRAGLEPVGTDVEATAKSTSKSARSLAKSHPGAAGSLREGLAETLTVSRLDVAPTLARSLRSTNAIESMIGICRDHSSNVKRWRDGQMALRWCAAGMGEASKQFRRVNGHLHLPALRTALNNHIASTVTPTCETGTEAA